MVQASLSTGSRSHLLLPPSRNDGQEARVPWGTRMCVNGRTCLPAGKKGLITNQPLEVCSVCTPVTG
jgi:hypothetical protein